MKFLSQNGVSAVAVDATVIAVTVVLTVLSVLAAIVFLCKCVKADVPKRNWALAVIFAVGFAVRLVFALTVRGYREDYGMFVDMFDDLALNGAGGYYKGGTSGTLYPTVYFVYLIFGGLSNATGLSDYALGMQFMVKLPLIICDLFAAYAVYKIACKYFNRGVGYVLCAFVCVCPAFFIASALWTSPIVLTAVFAVYACYSLAKKRYAATVGFTTAAVFSSKEGVFLFPVALVFCAFHFVRAVKNVAREKPKGRALLSSDYSAAYSVPVAVVASFVVAYLISLLPAAGYSYNPFKLIYEYSMAPLAEWSYFTYNGLSIFSVFNKNGTAPGARFPFGVFVGIFTVIVVGVVCVVYFTKRNRATLVMLASYVLLTLAAYYPGSTAVSMTVALIVTLAAYALVRDKRILYVLFVIAVLFVLNSVCALSQTGYLNNIADYYFDAASYTGSTLMKGGYNALNIACSAVAVLAHLYYTFVTVSVGMSGQKRLLNGADNIGDSFKDFFGGQKNAVENK